VTAAKGLIGRQIQIGSCDVFIGLRRVKTRDQDMRPSATRFFDITWDKGMITIIKYTCPLLIYLFHDGQLAAGPCPRLILLLRAGYLGRGLGRQGPNVGFLGRYLFY
jgi:hypothetical protein